MKIISSLILAGSLILGITQFQSNSANSKTPNPSLKKEIPAPSNCLASPYFLQVNQPNGTTISIIGKGNMNNSWTETTDGYTLVLENGHYEYAIKMNGELKASGILASDPQNRTSSESTYVSNLQKSLKPKPNPLKNSILSQVNAQLKNKTYPTTGNIRVLALLIDYPDLNNTYPKSNFDSLLYGSNYRSGDGSFKTYYETSSNGTITVDVDVVGWYRAANNYLYYSNDSGSTRAADLVREAVDAAELAGVNFANYDNNNDGDVDGVLAVHAGPGAESGSMRQYIWSHRWVLNGGSLGQVFYDGKRINDYMINPETRGTVASPRMVGIGVFCHEFGHNLGLPDLYDTDDSNGDSEGIGNWCLMAGGGWLGGEHRPVNFSAWCRIENNWDTPTVLSIGGSSSESLSPASTTQNEIIQVNTGVSSEYFLLENRQNTGLDLELPGSGLAVWHINTTKTNSSGNSVNADESLKGVDLEEADGIQDLDNEVNRGDGGDLFPGTSNITTFDDNSNPSARNYSLAATGLELRNIAESGTTLNFDFGPFVAASCSGGTTTILATSGTLSDGSPATTNYANNLNCSWLIQPANASSITLNFSRFDVDNTIDRVAIYDGTDFTAPLIGTYSGTTIPSAISSTGGNLYIEFTTNNASTGLGWEANYTSTIASINCSGATTTLTAPTGSFSDGSGSANYTNNQNCSWLIQPIGASSITFSLSSLATQISTDIIRVYDGTSNTASLLGSYSGTNNLNSLTSTGGSMFVEFTTDASIVDAGWDATYTSSNSGAGCSGSTTLTANSGSFSDGSGANDYDNNQFCSWLIQPPSGQITLNFTAFATQITTDRVLVYDGADNSATQIANYSGNSIPASLTSTSNSLYVEFRTDGSVVGAGWDANYTSSSAPTPTCSGLTNITSNTGTINDGSGTNINYSDNLDCNWLISIAGVNVIELNIDSMNLSAGDSLYIYDGNNNSATIIGKYSGSTLPPFVTTSGNSAFINFKSDASTNDKGWEISYTGINGCSGLKSYTAASGTFSDGTSPTIDYTNNQNCEWLIQPTGANFVTIDFNRFDTEQGFDFVTVYDGPNSTSTQIGTYSGNNIPASIVSSGNSLYVVFNSDNLITSTGWEITYNSTNSTCLQNRLLSNNTGSLSDGSGTSNYDNNLNCSWLIQPPLASSIVLTFGSFDTEATNDVVNLYDGTDNNGILIGSYSGSSIPAVATITGSNKSMFVEFISNATNTSAGWDATYTSTSAISCSGTTTLTAPSGNFDDGSGVAQYDNNLNCGWLIQPTGTPASITLTMNNINTDGFRDIVRVYDGTSATGPVIGFFFGTDTRTPVTAYSGSMFVQFTTNGNGQDQGWDASYVSSSTFCNPNTTFTNNNGNFTDGSPNGTDYLDNTNCEWLIQPGIPNTIISLDFSRFSTEAGFDSVTVYDGTSTSDPILRSLSGNLNNIPTITSTQGSMFVKFESDGNTTDNGWNAIYNTQQIPFCSGITNLTGSTGTFDDGSGNGTNYIENSNCQWLIQPTAGAITIDLSFNYFDTQNNQDVVSVYDGTTNSATLLGSFSGTTIPSNLTATSGSMLVEFISNGFFELNGFEATYTSSNNVILTASPDTVFINAAAGSTGSYAVTSNTNWQTSDNATWLITSPFNGNQNQTVNLLAIQPNIGPERYSMAFVDVITTTDRDTVIVAQRASGNFLQVDPDTLYFSDTPMASQLASISSSVSWTATSSTAWLTAGTLSGNNNGSSAISASQNLLFSPRIGYVVFAGNLGVANDTVFVKQDARPTVPLTLSVSPKNITLNSTSGSSDVFTVNSTTSWQTSTPASWLTVINPTNTFDTNTVMISTNSINPLTTDRNTYVAVQDAGGTLFDTVFVTQLGNTPNLTTNPDTVRLAANMGSTGTANILTNQSWNLSISAAWVSSNLTTGTNDASLIFTSSSDNNTGAERYSYAAVQDVGINLFDTIVIVQDFIPTGLGVTTNPDTIRINSTIGSTNTYTVNAGVSTSWGSNPNDNWISLSSLTGTGTQTIIVTANTANTSQSERMTYITTAASSLPLTPDTVFVIQNGTNNNFTVNPNSVSLNFNSGSSDVVTVTSNTSWTVSNPVTWLTTTPNSGINNGTVNVTANSDNLTGIARTASLSFDAAGMPSQIVTVTQVDGSIPNFAMSTDTVFLSNPQGSSETFSVLSNVLNWSLTENTSWLLVNPLSGNNTETITVLAASRNSFGNPRTALIIGQANGFPNDTVVVIQKETTPIFQVAPNLLILGSDSLDEATFNISSNLTNWTVMESSNWMDVSSSSGFFTQQITITAVDSNKTGNVRSDSIIVSSPPMVPQIVRVTQDTARAIGIEDFVLEQAIQLFPNPTSGMINISVGTNHDLSQANIKIYDMMGKLIPSTVNIVSSKNLQIDLSDEASGIYFINIIINNKRISKKVTLLE
jgi:M6 family metalloprotease-like protein